MRIFLKKSIVLCGFLILLSCNGNDRISSSEVEELNETKVIELSATDLEIDLKVGSVDHLLFKNALIIYTSEDPQHMINVLDLGDSQIITKGKKGYGPSEIMSSWSINSAVSADEFWICSPDQKMLSKFSIQKEGNMPIQQVKLENEATMVFEAIHISDSTFLGTNMDGRSVFTIFSQSGKIIKTIGEWEVAEFDKYPKYIIESIFEGRLRVNDSRTKVLYSCLALDRFKLFDVESGNIKEVFGPYNIEPKFSIGQSNGNPIYSPSIDTQLAFVDSYISEKWIYLLYSGRSQKEIMTENKMANNILVFDFDGNLKFDYQLDEAIKSFTVDEVGRVFYGITMDDDPLLLSFLF